MAAHSIGALAVFAVVALGSGPAAACASCGCGDPTLTASGVEKPYKNRIRLALEERYGAFTTGDSDVGEQTQFIRSSLAASWSPSQRLTLSALLPWVTAWIRPAARAQQLVSGLGDLELSLRGVLYRDRGFASNHLLWATAGIKLPTGYRVYDDRGYPFSDDDQPGSGSWDPFGGLTYAWFSGDRWSFYSSASYRYTTSGPRAYRRGSSLGGSAAVQLQPWPWGAGALGVDGLWTAPDTLPNGVESPNTGGVVGYLAPAVLLSPIQDLLLRFAVDIPIAHHLNGTQSIGTQAILLIAYDVK